MGFLRGLFGGNKVDKLLDELTVIGREQGFHNYSRRGDGTYDDRGYHIRTREIGEELNRIGGMKLMQTVHGRYRRIAKNAIESGDGLIETGWANPLEVAWDGIGEWQK